MIVNHKIAFHSVEQSKDWFTTWLALTDSKSLGVSFELLPFVDIGGTLTIGMHMDDFLMVI